MDMVDKSDEPTSVQDITEAISAIQKFMLSGDIIKLPELGVRAPTIRRSLMEYLVLRKQLELKREGI